MQNNWFLNVLVKSNFATPTPFGSVFCFVVGICLSNYNLNWFLMHQASYSKGYQRYLIHRDVLGSIWKIGRYPIKVSEVLCVYVRNNVFSKRRHDLELPNIECLWEKFLSKRKLIGTFYRPPNLTNAILSSIEDSIGLAFETNISNILITNDFNLNILKDNSSRKVRDLCQQFNFEQIINEPTHFMENSSSLIDLILTSNRSTILLSGVGEPFLEQNIR